MEIETKLNIANSGGSFRETGKDNWVGTRIRKGEKLGKVVEDWNGRHRDLVVWFDDGTKETIGLNNIGPNDKEVAQYEWLHGDTWYQF